MNITNAMNTAWMTHTVINIMEHSVMKTTHVWPHALMTHSAIITVTSTLTHALLNALMTHSAITKMAHTVMTTTHVLLHNALMT